MSLFPLTYGMNREGPEAGFVSAASHTYVGQAHLAASGPIGRTCRECSRWSWKAKVEGWAKISGPKPARCAKYRELMREWGKRVPHNAMACKYFEASDAPASLTKPEKVF